MRDVVRARMESAGLPGESVERAVYNSTIRRCRLGTVPCCWENVAFCDSYRSMALFVIRNADRIAGLMGSGVSAADAVTKKPHELRPDIWGDLLERKRQRDATYSAKPVANTSMYQCRSCRSRECHSFALQTRSGDEPMTIFIRCLNCGNRWRTEG